MVQEGSLLGVGQKAGGHGGIRKDEESGETDHDRETAKEDEHDPPALERRVNLLEAPAHEATNNLAYAKATVPEAEAGSLLRFGVPLTADEHQGRSDCGFEDAEEDTSGQESRVIRGGSCASRGDAPERDVHSEPLACRHLVEDVT